MHIQIISIGQDYYFFIKKMRKGQQKQSNHCNQHRFSLRPNQDNIINPLHLTASFCQKPANHPQKGAQRVEECSGLGCPVLNSDRCFAASTFVTRFEKQRHRQNPNIKYESREAAISCSPEKSQLFFPKPRSKNQYCYVCSKHYEDYLTHILQEEHHAEIASSPFNYHILGLAQKFQKKTRKIRQSRIRKEMKKVMSTVSCSEEEARMSPQKTLKKQIVNTYEQKRNHLTSGVSKPQQLQISSAKHLSDHPQATIAHSLVDHNLALQAQMWQNWNSSLWMYSNSPFWWPPQLSPHPKATLTYIIIDE